MADGTEVLIERIGAQGDGVAMRPEGPVFVRYALPGERWRLGPGGAAARITSHPDRHAPRCPHFERCGGCVAHHMADLVYRDWKRGIVVEALRQHGIAAEVATLIPVPERSRRRAVLTVRRTQTEVAVGFHEAGTHRLEPITACAVLAPAVMATLPSVGRIARLLLTAHDSLRVVVLASETGLDMAFDRSDRPLDAELRAAIGVVAERDRLARISIRGDPVVSHRLPVLTIAGVSVAPPPGGFVQAVPEAEAAIADLVCRAAVRARNVVDLFSGLGTLTLPLARKARVLAIDSDRAAIDALTVATRRAQGLKPVDARVRDLLREPLGRKELEGFDLAVFDPPRAGARAQVQSLARSAVPTIVAVSCNPATLARDLRILIDGGYRLEAVTPIDQFLYSAHVEAVAVLSR